MKGAAHYVAGGATLAFLAAMYFFSFPFTAWLFLRCWPHVPCDGIVAFYHPAICLAARCPPYLAILEYEAALLGVGIHYNLPPPGHP